MSPTMREVIADRWYRVDKTTGALGTVTQATVARAAGAWFDNPADVTTTGRFQTAFAIYSRGDLLTDAERSFTRTV